MKTEARGQFPRLQEPTFSRGTAEQAGCCQCFRAGQEKGQTEFPGSLHLTVESCGPFLSDYGVPLPGLPDGLRGNL